MNFVLQMIASTCSAGGNTSKKHFSSRDATQLCDKLREQGAYIISSYSLLIVRD